MTRHLDATNDLYRAFEAVAARDAGREAIVAGTRRIRYGALRQQAQELAGRLVETGVGAGDRVGVLLRNGPEFLAAILAIWKVEAIVLPLHTQLRDGEIEKSLRDCEVGVALVGAERRELQPADIGLLVWEGEERGWNRREGKRASTKPRIDAGPDPGDRPALTQYSTGSTGASKRVSRPHRGVLAEARALSALAGMDERDRILGVAAFCHSYAFTSVVVRSLIAGATIIAQEDFFPRDVARLIETERVTAFPGVPFMWQLLADLNAPSDLSSLRHAISAGAPLSPDTARKMRENYGVVVCQQYGTTETGAIAFNRGPGADSTSVGLPITGVEVQIVDEHGSEVACDVEGDVRVRTAHAARRYDEEVAHSDTWFEGEWFHTGDVGRLDAEGRLTLVGRKRGFINVAGNKVDPGEVEAVLCRHPAVAEAAVVAVVDRHGDEKIKAVVVPKSECTRDELLQHCRAYMADYKCPRAIEIRGELPKSPLGKVLRKYL